MMLLILKQKNYYIDLRNTLEQLELKALSENEFLLLRKKHEEFYNELLRRLETRDDLNILDPNRRILRILPSIQVHEYSKVCASVAEAARGRKHSEFWKKVNQDYESSWKGRLESTFIKRRGSRDVLFEQNYIEWRYYIQDNPFTSEEKMLKENIKQVFKTLRTYNPSIDGEIRNEVTKSNDGVKDLEKKLKTFKEEGHDVYEKILFMRALRAALEVEDFDVAEQTILEWKRFNGFSDGYPEELTKEQLVEEEVPFYESTIGMRSTNATTAITTTAVEPSTLFQPSNHTEEQQTAWGTL